MSQPKETKYRATSVSKPHKISCSAVQTLKSSNDLSSCGFYPTSAGAASSWRPCVSCICGLVPLELRNMCFLSRAAIGCLQTEFRSPLVVHIYTSAPDYSIHNYCTHMYNTSLDRSYSRGRVNGQDDIHQGTVFAVAGTIMCNCKIHDCCVDSFV